LQRSYGRWNGEHPQSESVKTSPDGKAVNLFFVTDKATFFNMVIVVLIARLVVLHMFSEWADLTTSVNAHLVPYPT
jgi:hypothetical protein